ncbi:MAG: flagellar hook-length control protein FliK [Eubacteriaceae bacterium]
MIESVQFATQNSIKSNNTKEIPNDFEFSQLFKNTLYDEQKNNTSKCDENDTSLIKKNFLYEEVEKQGDLMNTSEGVQQDNNTLLSHSVVALDLVNIANYFTENTINENATDLTGVQSSNIIDKNPSSSLSSVAKLNILPEDIHNANLTIDSKDIIEPTLISKGQVVYQYQKYATESQNINLDGNAAKMSEDNLISELVSSQDNQIIHTLIKEDNIQKQVVQITNKDSGQIDNQDANQEMISKLDINLTNFENNTFKNVQDNTSVNPVDFLAKENIDNVTNTIINNLETVSQGESTLMKVKLYPEELGAVDVMLKMEEGELIAKILVENNNVKQLFSDKINEINNNLKGQNINIISIDVDVSSREGEGSNQNNSDNQQAVFKQTIIDSQENIIINEKIKGYEINSAISVLA